MTNRVNPTDPTDIDDGVAAQLSADGTNGDPGDDGHAGAEGASGEEGDSGGFLGLRGGGSDGEDGQRGQHGLDGGDGQDGANGGDAGAIDITLTGSPDELHVSGSHTATYRLGDCDLRLLLTACGGQGGEGGKGGHGGSGGHGGQGENGATGSSGSDSMFDGGFGGGGGDGGDGGDGGAGGAGGRGGRGGVGGRGGSGGRVTVCAADPRLFMLVDVDVSGGHGGVGGVGGKGGKGGEGGSGGKGGKGGHGGDSDGGFSGSWGSKGRPGRDGRKGRDGGGGADASSGRGGPKGSVEYVVVDDQGCEIARSQQRFELTVVRYRVRSRNRDDVFEPDEAISIDRVVVENSGGLELPPGATLSFPSTPTTSSDESSVELPALLPGERIEVAGPFEALLHDKAGSALVQSRAELLGRPFPTASVPTILEVRYPIVIDSVVSPPRVGRGEHATIDITVLNVSSLTYGPPENGTVSVQCGVSTGLACADNSVDIDCIEPGARVTVSAPISSDENVPLYSRPTWHVDLGLRGRTVSGRVGEIQIIAGFDPAAPPTDVLLWHGTNTTQAEFLAWSRLLGAFGLTYRVWDVDLEENQSSPPAWAGRTGCDVIIASMDVADDMRSMDEAALQMHFQARQAGSKSLGASPVAPGVAILGLGVDDILAELLETIKPPPELLAEQRGASWISFTRGSSAEAEAAALRKTIQHNDPSNRYVVRIIDQGVHNIEVLRSRLRRDQRLVAQPVVSGRDLGEEWLADPQCTTFGIGSAHAQVSVAVACTLPQHLKLSVLQQAAARTPWRFQHPEWTFELADVVGAALFLELETELLGKDKSLPLLASLADSPVLEDPDRLPDEAIVALLSALECLVDAARTRAAPWVLGEGARRWRRVRSVRRQVENTLLKPDRSEQHRLVTTAQRDRSELATLARRSADGMPQLLESCPVEWPLRVFAQ